MATFRDSNKFDMQHDHVLCLYVFVALRPKSTAMVMVGQSVHLTTLFPGQAWTSSSPVLRSHTFTFYWQQPFLNDSAEGRRITVEIIAWSISTKVWDRARIELGTPGSWPFSEKLNFELWTLLDWGGRGSAGKMFATMCWIYDYL